MILRNTLLVCSLFLLIACGGEKTQSSTEASDLQFSKVETGKEYADLVLRAIKTNRDKLLALQFSPKDSINKASLNENISAYSQSIGKGNWDYIDEFAESKKKNASKGYDYTWHDQKGRIAIQINVLPENNEGKFSLKKLEFRSRIDVLESVAYPGGDISDYKKIKK